MEILLRELNLNEDEDLWNMFKEIDAEENGFINSAHNIAFDEHQEWLKKQIDYSQAINIRIGHVPQTLYLLYVNDKLVGYGKLRHYLNDTLLESGGNIGYVIRPSSRGMGYGNIILQELIKKASTKNINKVLLTCSPQNELSQKVILKNGGFIDVNSNENNMKFWIVL